MRIDEQMDEILDLISRSSRIAISSDPGSGKSTRIPPALVMAGYRVLILEPRRISAVSLATYISETQNFAVGTTIGYQVRGDSKRSANTKGLFATEAILPKYLDADSFLSEWDIVILDEFHERHLHTDVAWALLNQIQKELRPELKIVLLSATLNLEEIHRSWPDAQSLHIVNPPHPLCTEYVEVPKSLSDPHAVRRAIVQLISTKRMDGDVLVFLPGVSEIRRAREDLGVALRSRSDIKIMELYGAQSLSEQREALKKTFEQKIILATNVAESSITIDGVRTVIDSGLERVAWSNSKSGLTELKTERISKSSATQRSGRAARQGAGTSYRLWAESEQSALSDFQLAEIHRIDLSEIIFSILSSGWDPITKEFAWFERPHDGRLQDSLQRLVSLKLIDNDHKINTKQSTLHQYPSGLRGALYLESLKSKNAAISHIDCAIAAMISAPEGRAPHDLVYARDTEALCRYLAISMRSLPKDFDLSSLNSSQKESLICALPDRIFERRTKGGPSIKLSSGRGATLNPTHQHESEMYGIAILLRESDPDAVVSLFAPIEKALYRSLVLNAAPKKNSTLATIPEDVFKPELTDIQSLLKRAALFRGSCVSDFDLVPTILGASEALLAQNPKRDLASLQHEIIQWTQGMSDPKLWARFDQACPKTFTLPRTGRSVSLKYLDDHRVEVHARLQEFLGVTTHPKIAENQVALTLVLLSPAMRPIQITQRLEDFWTGSYIEIRKEMKARYPKHDW